MSSFRESAVLFFFPGAQCYVALLITAARRSVWKREQMMCRAPERLELWKKKKSVCLLCFQSVCFWPSCRRNGSVHCLTTVSDSVCSPGDCLSQSDEGWETCLGVCALVCDFGTSGHTAGAARSGGKVPVVARGPTSDLWGRSHQASLASAQVEMFF